MKHSRPSRSQRINGARKRRKAEPPPQALIALASHLSHYRGYEAMACVGLHEAHEAMGEADALKIGGLRAQVIYSTFYLSEQGYQFEGLKVEGGDIRSTSHEPMGAAPALLIGSSPVDILAVTEKFLLEHCPYLERDYEAVRQLREERSVEYN